MTPTRVIIITGLSGSGKSSAARALEDEGFFVVDNLPLVLLPQLLQLVAQGVRFTKEVGVVVDVRNRDFLAGLDEILGQVREAGCWPEIFFFDASDEILIRRYSETRRRHPLSTKEHLQDGIDQERNLLSGLRAESTVVVDTSSLTVHQLRSKVVEIVRGGDGRLPLVVQIQSFGFRYGIPSGSDLVMDVRFVPNPHFIPELQPLTGLDPAVSEYVLSQQPCQDFLQRFKTLLQFLIPQYQKEGKSYLTISVGCTGGRHRSVAIAEELGTLCRGEGVSLKVVHRDKDKG